MAPSNISLDTDLFTNIIQRSFQFELPIRSVCFNLKELMAESRYCLSFPQAIMNIFMDDEKKLMNCITYSLGEVCNEYQRPQMRVLESHLRLVNLVTESINELYQLQSEKKNFRPSIAKKEMFYQFVPINFHFQRCLINNSDDNNSGSLDVFTVGAFASHSLGFDHGGLQRNFLDAKSSNNNNNNNSNNNNININKNHRVIQAWHAMKDFFRISYLVGRIDSELKKLIINVDNDSKNIQLLDSIYRSLDSLAKQVNSILDPNDVEKTLLWLGCLRQNVVLKKNINDSMKDRIQEDIELEPVDLVHLNIEASLISIACKLNNEYTTKFDIEPGCRKLNSSLDALLRISQVLYAIEAIRMERDEIETFYNLRLRRSIVFSQALTSLIIGVWTRIQDVIYQKSLFEFHSVFVYFEVLLSCYAQEIGMLQDMNYAIEELNKCVTFVFLNLKDSDNDVKLPRIEGNGYNIRVVIEIKSDILDAYMECNVWALMFNIGINEHSTLAETFGHVRLQEDINKSSFHKLENFITDYYIRENMELIDYLTALKTELWSSRAKNVRILQLMEQITYKINGLRFTCCKSGKDRTSMAFTLEEVHMCSKLYDFDSIKDPIFFQQMLDKLRSEGIRRENTRKNIGIAKYAFSPLRVMTLPKLYRPPAGTFSNVMT